MKGFIGKMFYGIGWLIAIPFRPLYRFVYHRRLSAVDAVDTVAPLPCPPWAERDWNELHKLMDAQGYVRANITAAVGHLVCVAHAQVSIIICVESGAWWPWNLAPAECFEGGEPMRPLGDGEDVAEAEKPRA